jgi:Ser/Thr protein kinase RdoA (MazF antagonist)
METQRIAAAWPGFGGQLASWNAVGNAVHLVSSSGHFFLKQRPSAEQARREIELHTFLRARGLPVPECVPTSDGQPFAALDSGDRAVSYLYRALPGQHLPSFEGKLGLGRARRVGQALGRLHLALADVPSSAGFERYQEGTRVVDELGAAGGLYDVSAAQRIAARCTPAGGLPQQLIHRDFHRYNLLFTDETLSGYLDFDLAQRGPRLFDVCYCSMETLAQRFDELAFPDYWFRVLGAILKGYTEHVPLTDLERRSAVSMMLEIQLLAMHHFRNEPIPGRNAERVLHWLDARRHLIQAIVVSV